MSRTVFRDQSAKALQLTLLADLDTSQFHIMTRACQTFGDVSIEAAIIGASHFLRFSVGDFHLWEVFACTPVQGQQLASSGPMECARSRFQWQVGAHLYRFKSQIVSWREGFDRAQASQRAVERPVENHIQLSHTFPNGPFEQAPCTVVRVQHNQAKVCVETVHSYPNEAQIVFTTSQFSGGKH